MVQGKKPPMDIGELEGIGNGGKEPGNLTYVSGQDKKPPNWRGKEPRMKERGEQNPWVKPLIASIVAIVISLVAVIQLAPSKSNYNLLINDYTSYKPIATSALATQTGRIDNIVSTMTGYATRSELSRYATSDSITSINTQLATLSTLSGKVDTLSSKVDTLSGKVDASSGKVDALDSRLKTSEDKINALESSNRTSTTVIKSMVPVLSGPDTSGAYYLTFTPSITSYYIIKISLVYSILPSFGEAVTTYEGALTKFYTDMGGEIIYQPRIAKIGTVWRLSEATFNISSTSQKEAGKTLENIKIMLGPIAASISPYKDNYRVFVEVTPSSTTSVPTPGGF